MEHFVITHYEECVKALTTKGHKTCGALLRMLPFNHYTGEAVVTWRYSGPSKNYLMDLLRGYPREFLVVDMPACEYLGGAGSSGAEKRSHVF